jgi:hypothetical protein
MYVSIISRDSSWKMTSKYSYKLMTFLVLVLISCCADIMAQHPEGKRDTGPVYMFHPAITGWATSCVVIRGYVRIDDPSAGMASFGNPSDVIGRADDRVVSLGDSGVAVVSFSEPLRNNPGSDFAVFENSFDGEYLELAFVEVSTDSIRWVRFPSWSGTQTNNQTGAFGTTDPTNLYNLAGKYKLFFGTPFDLDELADSSGIDINNINYIRITDVVGSVDPLYGTCDSFGNLINAPWPTPFPQSGFDLDAVAVLDFGSVGINAPGADKSVRLWPVPVKSFLNIATTHSLPATLKISDINGRVIKQSELHDNSAQISTGNLSPGIYLLEIIAANGKRTLSRFIKSE